MQSTIEKTSNPVGNRKLLTYFILSLFTIIFLGCGEGKSASTKVNAPSTLTTFKTLRFVGSTTEFVNIIGGTSGVYSRSITVEAIDGSSVDMTLSGNFVYERTTNSDGKLNLSTVSVSFIGGLNTTVTPDQAAEFLRKPVDLLEVFEMQFAETPLEQSNVGTYRLLKTTTSGTQTLDTGTFEFGFTPGVSSTKLSTTN